MSASTQTHPIASTTPKAFVARFPLWLVTIGALVVAAAVTEVYGLVLRAAGVDLVIGGFGSSPEELPVAGLFMTVLMDGSPGIVLALAFARWASRPRFTWQRTAWTLTALSLVPLAFVEAEGATPFALGAAHLLAAAIVIPTVAARLADTNPRRA